MYQAKSGTPGGGRSPVPPGPRHREANPAVHDKRPVPRLRFRVKYSGLGV